MGSPRPPSVAPIKIPAPVRANADKKTAWPERATLGF